MAMKNFKSCKVCDFSWQDRNGFLSDPGIEIIGYQVDLLGKKDGFFLFNHKCGTTLSVPVSVFGDLYDGPKYKNILTDSEQCQGHCLDENDLSHCGTECKFAFGREIIQVIREWRKE
jgi:hypothetical protein